MTLSIIIVNWNTSALLVNCLASLRESEIGESEIWVVDNASTDDSAEQVARRFPEVQLIRNSVNAGFARANNQGIAASRGDCILLLNSDTLVPHKTLSYLVQFMIENPRVGACGPRLLRPDGTPQPYAFGDDPTLSYLLRRGLNRLLFARYLHDWSIEHTLQVDWVSGACLLLRRVALEQAGLLDEQFFMYFEDIDLCLRLRQAGWQVYYEPRVAITHLGGQSLCHNPQAQTAYQNSIRHFYARHYGPTARILLNAGLLAYNRLLPSTGSRKC
jgi:N-acetylglucosaminyl-diphospho-decaprenol L-rhamnosyltransferase